MECISVSVNLYGVWDSVRERESVCAVRMAHIDSLEWRVSTHSLPYTLSHTLSPTQCAVKKAYIDSLEWRVSTHSLLYTLSHTLSHDIHQPPHTNRISRQQYIGALSWWIELRTRRAKRAALHGTIRVQHYSPIESNNTLANTICEKTLFFFFFFAPPQKKFFFFLKKTLFFL